MAWIRFFNCDVVARSSTKSFILLNSSTPPASNPQESWKTKPGLLLNINSFSILCSPRWEMSTSNGRWWILSLRRLILQSYPHWSEYQISVMYKIDGLTVTHFFSVPIKDLRPLCGSTNALENSCLACICPAHNENSEHLKIFSGHSGSVWKVVGMTDSTNRTLVSASELVSLGGPPGRAPAAEPGWSCEY